MNVESLKDQSRRLLLLSRQDADALRLPLHDELFGMSAQQAIEKAVKAVIAARGVPYPFTHKLHILLKQAAALGESFPAMRYPAGMLTSFAMDFRYEGAPDLTEEDRACMRADAEACVAYAEARVAELLH